MNEQQQQQQQDGGASPQQQVRNYRCRHASKNQSCMRHERCSALDEYSVGYRGTGG
jgi:hypothetical protein